MTLKMALLFVNTSMLQNIVSSSMRLILILSHARFTTYHTRIKHAMVTDFVTTRKFTSSLVLNMICLGLSGCAVPWDVKAL